VNTPDSVLKKIDLSLRKEFDGNKRVLSFDEYLTLVATAPERQLRGSARYTVDMMDWYGSEKNTTPKRFRLFDPATNGSGNPTKVVGQEEIQNQIYRAFKSFTLQGMNNKLVLLHGPNGSAKTSIAHALMHGLENYSHDNEGAIYTLNWVFPIEKYTKGGIGLGSASREAHSNTSYSSGNRSYAKLPDEEVAARISCDLKDHPILVVPREHRRELLNNLIGEVKSEELFRQMPHYLTRGDLCHRCKQIFEALLAANGGDFQKVLAHVQVERFYFSLRYRKGIVTIEPQMHVDAQYHQLTYNRSMASLPASLQSLNLFSLTGDLVDGNRGIVEFSDLLKRPVDSFKYLLNACETGSISVGQSIAHLDTVFIGSTNELQLDAFKEYPDFTSFKGRIETIRVPYLLKLSEEAEIYQTQLSQIAGEKHVAPHVAWTIALWAVLTRLKRPNAINYPPSISSLVSSLTPLEKAKLYDSGELPLALSAEDKKLLRANLAKLRDEYSTIPYYEGRMGASAREIKSILFDAAQNSEFACLSPLAVMRELENFVKRVTEYEFLKQDVKDGYHDAQEFIHTTRNEYLAKIDLEVRDSIGLYESTQYEDFIRKYVHQISLALKREKVKNPVTGQMQGADYALIDEFEKIVEAPSEAKSDTGSASEKDAFRQNVISQVGAWSLDHPNQNISYAKVFPEFWRKIEKHFFESQKALLVQMHDAILQYGTDHAHASDHRGAQLAEKTIKNMQKNLGYCEHCAKEVITFLMKSKY